jgi:hypothetical protein
VADHGAIYPVRHLGRSHFSEPPISRLRVASRWPSRCNWQRAHYRTGTQLRVDYFDQGEEQIATKGDEFKALDAEEIDELCGLINSGEG